MQRCSFVAAAKAAADENSSVKNWVGVEELKPTNSNKAIYPHSGNLKLRSFTATQKREQKQRPAFSGRLVSKPKTSKFAAQGGGGGI